MNAITIQRHSIAPLEFTPEQRKMILASFLNGASEAEAAVLMELARVRRLNPITRQIHFVKRWDSDKNGYVWASQVGIDGFRTIAERTGLYDGQDEAEFSYDPQGKLFSCKVRVYRKDWSRPAVGIAHFSEYVQNKKDGKPNKMWAEKPHVMLAKCAEAIAFRRGFPEDTSGLYSPEEMPDQDAPRHAPAEAVRTEREVNAPPPVTLKAVEPPPASPPRKKLTPVECDKDGKPIAVVTFGPVKGKTIASLSAQELSASIALGEERIAASPSALWAAAVSLCLADLKHEHGARIDKAIDAEKAK